MRRMSAECCSLSFHRLSPLKGRPFLGQMLLALVCWTFWSQTRVSPCQPDVSHCSFLHGLYIRPFEIYLFPSSQLRPNQFQNLSLSTRPSVLFFGFMFRFRVAWFLFTWTKRVGLRAWSGPERVIKHITRTVQCDPMKKISFRTRGVVYADPYPEHTHSHRVFSGWATVILTAHLCPMSSSSSLFSAALTPLRILLPPAGPKVYWLNRSSDFVVDVHFEVK